MSDATQSIARRHVAVVVAGYAVILLLLGLAVKMGLDNLNALNQSLRTVVEENNVKAQQMTAMRDAIRERILLLHTAINLDDPFEIDEAWQQYSAEARNFIIARDRLDAMVLTDDQRRQLTHQREILAQAQPILDRVIEAVRDERRSDARAMVVEAQALNARVTEELQEMVDTQQQIAEQSVSDAADAMVAARGRILTVIGAAVAVATAILLVVVTVISRQGRSVSSLLDQLAEANVDLERKVEERTGELMKTREENVRMSAELAVTHQLQQMLLPRDAELEAFPELTIAAAMRPAEEAGGDYYDVLQYGGRVIIGVGDVTGHGLESSVVMLMAQTAVRTLAAGGEPDPVRFLSVLNRVIYDNLQRIGSYKNLTLMLGYYQNDTLTICGQHEELLYIPAASGAGERRVERIDTLDLGFPLGLEQEIEQFLRPHQVRLDPGDTVVLYTDGITEAENEEGAFYGLDRLTALILDHVHEPVQYIHDRVIEDLHAHIGRQKVYDDITLVVFRRD